MSKTKPRNGRETKTIRQLKWTIAALILANAVFGVLLLTQHNSKQSATAKNEPSVSIQMLEYEIVDGRARKIDTPYTRQLKDYLKNKAASEGCASEDTPYEHVASYTADRQQIRLAYGCGGPTSFMYIVRENDSWRAISPTNNFNQFGIPYCQFIEANSIRKEIAPVCANGNPDTAPPRDTYTVR